MEEKYIYTVGELMKDFKELLVDYCYDEEIWKLQSKTAWRGQLKTILFLQKKSLKI